MGAAAIVTLLRPFGVVFQALAVLMLFIGALGIHIQVESYKEVPSPNPQHRLQLFYVRDGAVRCVTAPLSVAS